MAAEAAVFPTGGSEQQTVHGPEFLPVNSPDNVLNPTHLALGSPSNSGVQFSRCYSKLCSLRPSDNASFKTELNLLFDQLISENYNIDYSNCNIRPEVSEILR